MKNWKKELRLLSTFTLLILAFNLQCQVKIKQTLFGQSAWFIDPLNINNPGIWGYLNKVRLSGVKYIRIGGIGPNFQPPYSWDNTFKTVSSAQAANLKTLIDSIRYYGMEPIITVGYNPICTNNTSQFWNVSRADQAKIAGELVKRINKLDYTSNPIKYWIIANEPDHGITCANNSFGGFGYNTVNHADTIASYIKSYATQMKQQDSTIKIIGPEWSGMGNDTLGNPVTQMMNKLCTNPATFPTTSIMGKVPSTNKFYVDILSFHYYPFGLTNKTDVVNHPQQLADGFRARLSSSSGQRKGVTQMITNLSNNTGRTINDLKLACTEFNIDLFSAGANEVTNYNDVIDGRDSRSFIGGQFWADVYSEAMSASAVNQAGSPESWMEIMTPWSIREGGCTSGLGYLSACSGNNGEPRPSYVHYKLVAENMQGVYYGTVSIAGGNNKVKTFTNVQYPYGYKVMILNQDTANDYHFLINTKTSNAITAGSNPLTLNFNFGVDTFLNGKLSAFNYKSPKIANGDTLDNPIKKSSTIVLTFDCEGNLMTRLDYTIDDAKNKLVPKISQIGDNVINPDLISCSLPGIGGTLSTNTIFSNTIVPVNSDITLATGVSLKFDNCLVIMSAGTKIVGGRGNTIELHKSIVLGCGGEQWDGIYLTGVYSSESLIYDSSVVINANHPASLEKVPNIQITNNFIVNGNIGSAGVELNQCKGFTIKDNVIGAFETGISTHQTEPHFKSYITGNKIMDVDNGLHFDGDSHDSLFIECNAISFRGTGILSSGTNLKDQGTSSTSAGNKFLYTMAPDQTHFIEHSGSTPTYYYGPSEAALFTSGVTSGVTASAAGTDQVCAPVVESKCYLPWPVNVQEQQKDGSRSITVYPNPGTGAFTLNMINGKGVYTLTVYNVMGRIVTSKNVEFSGTGNAQFEIKEKGLYIVSLQNEKVRMTQKVIVE